MVVEAIERARAYAEAGADGLFAPGLADITLMKAPQKKAAGKTKAVGNKTIGAKTVSGLKKRVREKSQSMDTVAFSPDVIVDGHAHLPVKR